MKEIRDLVSQSTFKHPNKHCIQNISCHKKRWKDILPKCIVSTNEILLCMQNVCAVNMPRQPCCQTGGVGWRISEKGFLETGDPTDLLTPFRCFTGLGDGGSSGLGIKVIAFCSDHSMLRDAKLYKVSGNSESMGFRYKLVTDPVLREIVKY